MGMEFNILCAGMALFFQLNYSVALHLYKRRREKTYLVDVLQTLA